MNKSPLYIDIENGIKSQQKYKDGILLGIDIGNNYCRIAAVQNEQLTFLVDEYGSSSIPLVLSCLNTGIAIGNAAARRADSNWNNTIYDIKRVIGPNYDYVDIQRFSDLWSFDATFTDGHANIILQHKGVRYYTSGEELLTHFLYKLRLMAEDYFKCTIRGVTITMPNDMEVEKYNIIEDICNMVGLPVVEKIFDNVAIACAYHERTLFDVKRKILIFNIGAGAYDITIAAVGGDGHIDVLASRSNCRLGGQDFTMAIMDIFLNHFYMENKDAALARDRYATHCLVKIAERAKLRLTTMNEILIDIPNFLDDMDFTMFLSRETFNEMSKDLFNSIKQSLCDTFTSCHIKKNEIKHLVLCGGSVVLPKLKKIFTAFFNSSLPPIALMPAESVAMGAALYAVTYHGELNY